MKMNKKGFTLIELLVVVLIIGILAAIALPQYFKAMERARSAEALSILTALGGAQQRYYLAYSEYAENFGDLDIDFVDEDHQTVGTTSEFTTGAFTIAIDVANGVGTATRDSGRYQNYRITKNFETGRVSCDQSEYTGGEQICTSIGLKES